MLDVVNKAALKADPHRPVHSNQQDDTGGENRHKKLTGDPRTPEFHGALLLPRRITTFLVVSFGTLAKIKAGRAIITAMLR
ncbi:Uncharacterised protein [Enterobacter cloacae]|nr:Uncharacterised protein [Enterobacter cloacae]